MIVFKSGRLQFKADEQRALVRLLLEPSDQFFLMEVLLCNLSSNLFSVHSRLLDKLSSFTEVEVICKLTRIQFVVSLLLLLGRYKVKFAL